MNDSRLADGTRRAFMITVVLGRRAASGNRLNCGAGMIIVGSVSGSVSCGLDGCGRTPTGRRRDAVQPPSPNAERGDDERFDSAVSRAE